jgi:hypothetical protein
MWGQYVSIFYKMNVLAWITMSGKGVMIYEVLIWHDFLKITMTLHCVFVHFRFWTQWYILCFWLRWHTFLFVLVPRYYSPSPRSWFRDSWSIIQRFWSGWGTSSCVGIHSYRNTARTPTSATTKPFVYTSN